ncbi:hypothetical protein C2E21_6940 [Chlorella sorokiniana]|uniref:Disintegrin domain-containing protein n=1 Tax=Chlorella sorokiniana TaxID=3076 RepID=A0A2P6TJC8_CHLSO|nr:hypothetical protein C2E21_6940 [Chlorella sorokiniana]|eukprot:PRW39356.1 hypothetical protein C2E21_6940 [Chlorella sorokiniana]
MHRCLYAALFSALLAALLVATEAMHLLGDCFPCSSNCATCSEIRTLRDAQGNPTGFKEVTIDASSCKNADLSWMCCRGASNGAANLACTLKPGGCSADGTPVYDFGKNKCNSKVQMGTFIVPNIAASVTIQIHDGRAAGTVNCDASANRCCGGSGSSCGTGTGVCEWVIANPFKSADTQCRAAAGDCDLPAKCTGSSKDCPANPFQPNTHVCRGSAGICDVEEKCTGSSAACPDDTFLPNTVTCRAAAGPCDVEEKCTGSAAACPADAKRPNGFVCRPAKDLCDVAEKCDGTSNDCPMDIVLRNKAKVFKDCFYCGMPAGTTAATLSREMTQLKNTWALGTCNTGSCDNHVFLTNANDIAKYCGATLPTTCPNNKALSNVAHGVCNGSTGTWNCILKQDAPFSGPVVAPWAMP